MHAHSGRQKNVEECRDILFSEIKTKNFFSTRLSGFHIIKNNYNNNNSRLSSRS